MLVVRSFYWIGIGNKIDPEENQESAGNDHIKGTFVEV